MLLRWNGVTKELYGGEPDTTNNRMELTAAINALNALKEPCNVDLYTDSVYVSVKINVTRFSQCIERIDCCRQLHTIIGGVGFTAVKFFGDPVPTQ